MGGGEEDPFAMFEDPFRYHQKVDANAQKQIVLETEKTDGSNKTVEFMGHQEGTKATTRSLQFTFAK